MGIPCTRGMWVFREPSSSPHAGPGGTARAPGTIPYDCPQPNGPNKVLSGPEGLRMSPGVLRWGDRERPPRWGSLALYYQQTSSGLFLSHARVHLKKGFQGWKKMCRLVLRPVEFAKSSACHSVFLGFPVRSNSWPFFAMDPFQKVFKCIGMPRKYWNAVTKILLKAACGITYSFVNTSNTM